MLKLLIKSLLDNDDGISDEAYEALLNYLASIDKFDLIEDVNNKVNSANGRYYFPEYEGNQYAFDIDWYIV